MVGSIFYLTNPNLTLTLTLVNQIYIRYFKERGMCYKTDKILKKTLKKKQLLKKNIEKNKIDIAKKCDSWDSNLQPPAWRTQDRAIGF